LLFEEFLAREAKAGQLDEFKTKLKPVNQPVLLHGHCHQKAFAAVTPVMEVLSLIPGAKPELIESSCCGMAGSFGYEAEHFDVSMQIADGAQREAVHVARLLASRLE
jgi:Fe-S oxidoreductase